MNIDSNTKLNAVIGYPLTHSLSARVHSHVYEQHDLNAVMLAFQSLDIHALVSAIRTLHIGLTAVTIPHKETIIPLLDELEPRATRVGAVNTVIQREQRLVGYNTDVIGIEHALSGVPLAGTRALVLGAGGAARAVVEVLSAARANIWYCSRTPSRAEKLVQVFGGTVLGSQLDTEKFDLIINATPVGMHPNVEDSPLPGYRFHAKHMVMDCIYNPLETRLLREARAAGARVIPGIEMFAAQGVEQIRLWAGISVDPQLWRETLKSYFDDYEHHHG